MEQSPTTPNAAAGPDAPELVELESRADLEAAYPVMRELRPQLTAEEFRQRLKAAGTRGYRLFALKAGGRIMSLIGVEVMLTLHNGRELCIQELVTTVDARSHGYGKRIVAFAEDLARQEACRAVYALSNVVRHDAHRFYEREGYRRVAYEFRKDLA